MVTIILKLLVKNKENKKEKYLNTVNKKEMKNLKKNTRIKRIMEQLYSNIVSVYCI